jgi:HEAT repeat protein
MADDDVERPGESGVNDANQAAAAASPDSVLRYNTALELAGSRDTRAVWTLVHLLEDEQQDESMREDAAKLLGELRATEYVEWLIGTLGDPSDRVRFAVVVALGNLGDSAALDNLTYVRDHEEWDVLSEAAGRGVRQIRAAESRRRRRASATAREASTESS